MPDPLPSFLDRARAVAQARVTTAQQQHDTALTTQKNVQQARIQTARQQAQNIIAQAEAYISPSQAIATQKMNAAQQASQQVTALVAQYHQQLQDVYQRALTQQVNVKVAGAGQATIPFYAIVAIPANSYQAVFDAITARSYRLISFSAYANGPDLFYNVIWQSGNTLSWYSWNQLTDTQYQQYFNEWVGKGYRLFRIHTYTWQNQIWYAPIFVQNPGPSWQAYHGVTTAQHQDKFNQLNQQGYRLVNWSVTSLSGQLSIAALYQQVPGTWVSLGNLNATQYQNAFDQQTQAGLTLADLSVATVNDTPTFWANWSSQKYKTWVAHHNLDTIDYFQQSKSAAQSSMWTRVLTGYTNGNTPNYAALWAS